MTIAELPPLGALPNAPPSIPSDDKDEVVETPSTVESSINNLYWRLTDLETRVEHIASIVSRIGTPPIQAPPIQQPMMQQPPVMNLPYYPSQSPPLTSPETQTNQMAKLMEMIQSMMNNPPQPTPPPPMVISAPPKIPRKACQCRYPNIGKCPPNECDHPKALKCFNPNCNLIFFDQPI